TALMVIGGWLGLRRHWRGQREQKKLARAEGGQDLGKR
ncbi:unnamed protein product, partial [marine sediment metagenome]